MTPPPGDLAARIAGLFRPWDRPDSPGAVLLVRQGGEDLFFGAWGVSNINEGVPLARRSVLRIGSQSKQFTVLLALMLEAEGKLSMDDPVHRHFPELPDLGHTVTLAHLASNTSGWRDHFQALTLAGLSIWTPSDRQATLDVIAGQEALNFPPGSALSYSNSGFVLLSELIERIEGKSYDAVLQERIAGPLGMRDTALRFWDGRAAPGMATHYTRQGDGWYSRDWGLPIGGEGGIVSTVDDMMLWLANFDSPKVGTPARLARMQTPPRFPGGAVSGYGMGLVCHDYRGRRFVGHGGSIAGGLSEGGRFPDQDLSIVLLANCDRIAPLRTFRRVADICFGDEPPAPLPFRPGRYRRAGGAEVIELREENGQPQMMSAGSGFDSLDCGHPLGAARESGLINTHYVPQDDGTVTADFCGQPLRYLPLAPGARARAPLTGHYRQPAQGFEVEIETDLQSGRFLLRSPVGVFRGWLVAVDADLWLLVPQAAGLGAAPLPEAPLPMGTGWMATVAVTAGGLLLETARNKRQAFERLD